MFFGAWKDNFVGSGYGKIVFSISCYHFSLTLLEFCPLHADLHLQIAERKFLCWLVYWYGSISWGERAVIARGNITALSIPLISLLWNNCTETRV